eukprot:TRINITY_DN3144_c0_g1_i1.p1 TRINITY_DN3144_c0_g1~~TRINITY_DN3144_c0_g1_i1.p1  ORF type:complete len:106 (+),score=16.11 TRINITY_DN3144_c0_g1_i1:285-602(+)
MALYGWALGWAVGVARDEPRGEQLLQQCKHSMTRALCLLFGIGVSQEVEICAPDSLRFVEAHSSLSIVTTSGKPNREYCHDVFNVNCRCCANCEMGTSIWYVDLC